MVALMIHEDLGLVFKPPESRGMDNPVPVPLETGAGFAFRLLVETSPAIFRTAGVCRSIIHGH